MNRDDWVEQEVEEHNQRNYFGHMSPRSKQLLREMKRKEYWELWDQRDYVYGKDDGEVQDNNYEHN